MGLGLITLFFLVSFSALYADKSIAKRPEMLSKLAAKVADNAEVLSFWGMIYSLIALFLTPVLIGGGFAVMMMVLANVLLFLLVLPHTINRLIEACGDKMPSAVASELRELVEAISRRERIMAYAGAALSFLLFVALTA